MSQPIKDDALRNRSPRSDAGLRPRGPVRRFLPLAVIALLAGFAFAMGWHKYLSLEMLVMHRAAIDAFLAAHPAAAVLAFIGIYAAVIAIGLPGGLVLTATGGLLFGVWIGGAAAIVGATIGATLIFLVARSAFGSRLVARAGPLAIKLAKEFRRDAFNYLLFLRLVPVFPFFLVNLVPALCNVPLRTYVIATFLGIIPGTFAFASVGAGLDSVIAAQAEVYRQCVATGSEGCHVSFNLRAAVTPEILFALGALGLLALMPVAVRRIMGQRIPDKESDCHD